MAKLGKASYEKHGKRAGPAEVITPIEQLLTRSDFLANEIDALTNESKGNWLRDNPEWQELVPHLHELRIDVVLSEDLSAWDDAAADFHSPVKDQWLSLRHQTPNE